MTKEYPKELVSAFLKCRKSKWSDETYPAFAEEAKKFLKSKAEDTLEHSKLVVELARTYKDKDEKKIKEGDAV